MPDLSSFLNSLHWPEGDGDFGKFSISYIEIVLMIELWSGYRLRAEVVRRHASSGGALITPSLCLLVSGNSP